VTRTFARAGAVAALLAATPAVAGPPYDTDDPEPTELHHWEIYGFGSVDGFGGSADGAAGLDLNYGAAPDVQLTATVPFDFETGAGTHVGRGDLELGVKYRFLRREKAALSMAVFPRIILPTASRRFGTGRVQLLLPIWAQKDIGAWSVFGGGGYTINPGAGNRDFWQVGLAATHPVTQRLSLGAEAYRQGAEAVGTRATTRLGLGGIYKLGGPYSLLASGGPEFEDGRSAAGFHAYFALGLSF
jgi:hypothetical protein